MAIYLISKGYRSISKEAKEIVLKADFMLGVAILQSLQIIVYADKLNIYIGMILSFLLSALKIFIIIRSIKSLQELITFLKVTVMIHE